MNLHVISRLFRSFAERECSGTSPLYKYLSLQIAEDEELLKLAAQAHVGQPIPNLFFGSVHYLLLKGREHPLQSYYPSIVSKPNDYRTSYPLFRDFCLSHRQELISLLKNQRVQTNEVRRAAYLYPCFCYIFEKVKKPISLVEIGTSAGLLLLWDQFSYSYGSSQRYGNLESTINICSEIKGSYFPPLSQKCPPVEKRIGIDLHINDLTNQEDLLWLKSLVWPEHQERRNLLEKASSYLKTTQINLIEGDAIELLYDTVASLPETKPICIFHTHVANQLNDDAKHQLLEIIRNLGQKRTIFHLYNNMWDRLLHLDYYLNGKEFTEILAETNGHGRWFCWMANSHETGHPTIL